MFLLVSRPSCESACTRPPSCTIHTSLQALVTDAPTHSRWLKLRHKTELHFVMVAECRQATSRMETLTQSSRPSTRPRQQQQWQRCVARMGICTNQTIHAHGASQGTRASFRGDSEKTCRPQRSATSRTDMIVQLWVFQRSCAVPVFGLCAFHTQENARGHLLFHSLRHGIVRVARSSV